MVKGNNRCGNKGLPRCGQCRRWKQKVIVYYPRLPSYSLTLSAFMIEQMHHAPNALKMAFLIADWSWQPSNGERARRILKAKESQTFRLRIDSASLTHCLFPTIKCSIRLRKCMSDQFARETICLDSACFKTHEKTDVISGKIYFVVLDHTCPQRLYDMDVSCIQSTSTRSIMRR